MHLRRLAALAALIFAATTALAGGLGDMTTEERAAFRDEVRRYLIDNPEVLVEAMDALQARQDLAAAARDRQTVLDQAALVFHDPASWAGGNLQGDITIVEFVDYRCGYCRKAHDEVAELVASDGNIRFVLKEYPILGEESMISSRFAIAVLQLHGDAAYKAMHDALIRLRGAANPSSLALLAGEAGFDPAPILTLMDSEAVTSVIAANHALAELLQISGTPTFVVKDTLLRGYLPLEDMRQIVAEARAG